MNIVDLIESAGVKLTRQGKNFRGKCPFHNGESSNSLLVDIDAGLFHCFGCGKHGDSIQWIRDSEGVSFIEACNILGHDPGPQTPGPRLVVPKWEPKEPEAPIDLWQGRAKAFLDMAVACLWSERGDKTRAWLYSEKGLSDTVIEQAGLGLNLVDIYEPRAKWGLAEGINGNGNARKQWIPAGLVIPLILNGKVHRLRIRRPGKTGYVIVSGSSPACMNCTESRSHDVTLNDKTDVFVIVESELDGMLVYQEAGEVVKNIAVIATGTATAKPDKATHEALKAAKVILVSLDSDDAGVKGSVFWLETYSQASRWPCVNGKDPSEARVNGLNLKTWVTMGIKSTLERLKTANA